MLVKRRQSFISVGKPVPGRLFKMIQDPTYTLYADEGEMLPPLQSISPERGSVSVLLEPVLSVMSVSALAGHCMREISNYRRGETGDERSCVELFRRATLQGDPSAGDTSRRTSVGLYMAGCGVIPTGRRQLALTVKRNM